MNMNLPFIRFNSDSNPGAGGTAVATPPAAPVQKLGGVEVDNSLQPKAPTPPALNLDSKITADGKEYTVSGLLADRRKMAEMEGQLGKLQKVVSTAFAREEPKSLEDLKAYRENSYEGFVAAGWTPQEAARELAQIDARISKMEKGEPAEEREATQEPQGPTETERHYLNTVIESGVQKHFLSSPSVTKLVKVVEDTVGKEQAGNFLANAKQDLLREIGSRVKGILAKNGASYVKNPAWIEQVLPDAVKATMERYSPMIATVEALGKSRSAQTDPLAFLDTKKPVDVPTFNHGADSRARFDAAADAWVEDAMMRQFRQSLA